MSNMADGGTFARNAGIWGRVQASRVWLQGFPSESSWSASEGTFLEHVLLCRVYCPIVALSGSAKSLWKLYKAFIKREVVANRILPSLVRATEERKLLLK